MATDTPLNARLEALFLIADEPLDIAALSAATGAGPSAVKRAIAALVADYDGLGDGPRRGFELRAVGTGWRYYVRADHDDLVREVLHGDTTAKLSTAALETLAVIAYKQPITRAEIASIRAVNVDSVVRTLAARGLIIEESTDPETGALRYATTELLLEQLGITTLDELPRITPLLADGSEGFDADVR